MSFRVSLLQPFIGVDAFPGGNLVVTGPPGVGKTLFCETILCEWLKTGTRTLYITLDHAPHDVRQRIEGRGTPLNTGDLTLVFVDGYSWLVGETTEQYSARNLSNLSDLSVKMISASNTLGKGIFFIFDSISSLLIYNSENEVERFLGVNMARMKHLNNFGLWVVEQGIHSQSFYNVLRHKADGVFEMRFEDQDQGNMKRFIRLHTFKGTKHSTDWKSFDITEGEVDIEGREKDLYLTVYMKNS